MNEYLVGPALSNFPSAICFALVGDRHEHV